MKKSLNKSYGIGLALALGCMPLFLKSQAYDIVVAKDGSGDYSSLTFAFQKIPFNSTERTLIFVKAGMYEEKVALPASKQMVSLIGEHPDSVIVSWDDYSGKTPSISTAGSYTFLAEGDDFYAEGITFRNTAGPVGQAVAIRTTGERQVFKNCRFLGFQDTYYAHSGRQYNVDCYVEGATDFIFGDATAVFENCTIQCVQGGQYITAPSDTKLISTLPGGGSFYHGLLFLSCNVTAAAGVSSESYYLGRPWQPNGSSVFVSCVLGDHIRSEGWSVWSGDNHLSGTYAEFESENGSGLLIDTTARADWSEQLTAEEVDAYYNLDYFLKKDNVSWDPTELIITLDAPAELNVTVTSNMQPYELTWSAVTGAIGYTIFRNDEAIGFSETTAFSDTSVNRALENEYFIKAVSPVGSLGEPSLIFHVEPTALSVARPEVTHYYIRNKILFVDQGADITLFSISGKVLDHSKRAKEFSLNNYLPGVYLVRMILSDGKIITTKIVL